MTTFSVILQSCPESSREAVGQYLGRAFSLKDATCAAIAGSAPIVLLVGLTREEAAAAMLALSGLKRMGTETVITDQDVGELPKIDWPRRPQVFKRDLADHIADLQLAVDLPGPGRTSLLSLLLPLVGGPSTAPPVVPLSTPLPEPRPMPAAPAPSAQEFRGIQLPEITPFSTPVLPQAAEPLSSDDAMSRLNELFPDEGGFIPNNQDITSILNRLLPDEAEGASSGDLGRIQTKSVQTPMGTPRGYAVFLAKIADENRRTKAIPLLVELAKITAEEADALSRKVIIPVLKGASKEDAESAKQRFAKIGILARVKAPE